MKTGIAVIIALAVVGGGWYWYTTTAPGAQVPATSNTTDNNGADVGVTAGANAPTAVTVMFTADGFSPELVTVKKGGTVTFINEGTGEMWVASASHPTHTVYSGTTREEHCSSGDTNAFDQCASGTNYSFTFDKIGSWNYHNHKNSSQVGTVVVVE